MRLLNRGISKEALDNHALWFVQTDIVLMNTSRMPVRRLDSTAGVWGEMGQSFKKLNLGTLDKLRHQWFSTCH